MGIYAGFDTFSYPGDAVMQSLWDHTNLYWCGFYLGPRYNFAPKYVTLASMGWGVAPIYMEKRRYRVLGGMSRAQQFAMGQQDGREAVAWARQASIQPPTTLYFDVEAGDRNNAWLEYFAGWSRAVADAYYGAGCYCSYLLASWVVSSLMNRPGFDTVIPTIWAFNIDQANPNGSVKKDSHGNQIPWAWLSPDYPVPPPSDSGYSAAIAWQRAHGFGLQWEDASVGGKPVKKRLFPADLNTAFVRDPGNPALRFLD